jgi:hypothetical protein
MLRSVKGLKGSSIHATDGTLGHVEEFYFDDEQWVVRYMVADTGGLFGHKVLISPSALGRSDFEGRSLEVSLTRDQIRHAPAVGTVESISRRWERGYAGHFGWPYYWGGAGTWGADWYPNALFIPPPDVLAPGAAGLVHSGSDQPADAEEYHIRSTDEVTGYAVHADGDFGRVEDFILDDETWAVRYLSIDSGTWLPGRKVLVPPQWCREITWLDRSVTVDLTREQIRSAPEWDPSGPISRDYEAALFAHYGRTPYWQREASVPRAA